MADSVNAMKPVLMPLINFEETDAVSVGIL